MDLMSYAKIFKYLVTVVGDDDDGAPERSPAAEGHVSGDGQVIKFEDVRNRSKPLQEVAHLMKKSTYVSSCYRQPKINNG